jgi:pectate lyase
MKKVFVLLFLISCFCSLGSDTDANALPAFPGAEGFGSTTPGGRGGRVIEVTNLNESGAGSFREACLASGPRIVVFRTGGLIQLYSDIEITNPFITIAGQTAPGDGITIKGAPLRIYTHDVIIRALRMRIGDSSGSDSDNRDGLVIGSNVDPPQTYNIIVDHSSVSWSLDENFSTYRPCHDITFQWCIASEALRHGEGSESYGFLIGQDSTNISIHHCLLASNKDRSPLLYYNSQTEVINNLIYNWRAYATRLYSGANIIGNFYKTGPNWTGGKGIAIEDVAGVKVFVKDNVAPGRETNVGDDWLAVNDANNASQPHRSQAMVIQPSGIKTNNPMEVYELVLNNTGAISPRRDAVDQRVVQSVRDGTGNHIVSQDEVGGWPTYDPGQPPTDTDHDGMPDAWELAHGLDPNNPSDANADRNGEGYTNIEEYINSLISMPGVALPAPENVRVVY